MPRLLSFSSLLCSLVANAATAEPPKRLHSFAGQRLTDVYYSEGINAADFNGDGKMDIVQGPFWYEGPDFMQTHPIYPAKPQNRDGYADSFFSWPWDFNGDQKMDILAAGFPGTPAYIYVNPGPEGAQSLWKKIAVFDWVSNESPQFTNLVGDAQPELVCTRDGYFGYASINRQDPLGKWSFTPISARIAPDRFGHGLGVGDVNGDGRQDVIVQMGWFEQPADLALQAEWTLHPEKFAPKGGADMFAYDVDGDGDNDVITSLAAHEFGLSWFEQQPGGRFQEHLIMGDRPSKNAYGLAFSELHSVALADMDGDGLKDIVTGKTYWSHHAQAPGWDAGAVVYWFKLVRGEKGQPVDWVPMLAGSDSGIGRQIVVKDINADKLPDILAGGMKGAYVLRHATQAVSEAEWLAAQPKRVEIKEIPPLRGQPAKINAQTGTAEGPGLLFEGESAAFLAAKPSKGSVSAQPMKNFPAAQWSGGQQIFWRGGNTGDTLELEISVPLEGKGNFHLETVFTIAPDYPIVQLSLDGKPVGAPLDLYDGTTVATTGVLSYPLRNLAAGAHKLGIRIIGTNPSAAPAKFVGLDFLRLVGEP